MNPLSPRNSTPRQLFFSANSPTGTQRHPSPTPDRLQTLSHPSTPAYSPATSTHPRATALPVNLSNPATFTVNHEEFESFDLTRTLDFSSVTSPQTSVALLSGNDSIGSGESTRFNRQHFVGSPHTTGPLNNALANNDILAHWRWLLDGIPDDDDVDIESGTSENENVEHIRHQNAGIDDHEDMEMEQPDIEMDAAEDASRLRSRPIPLLNDPHFPQEKTVPGLRGKKATLKELFYLPSVATVRVET
ncbi:hypothetical protein AM587_10004320 [Phytophthora nicotianae]|uniref:Uncharacterized protein n=1 Tax=Phytophthora nicotianae TaxID=4792 RepID=A0A0W8CNJ1_PHYNI|nr:hypothetical protein AM587_10004320 [Phytophthora nicotianae]